MDRAYTKWTNNLDYPAFLKTCTTTEQTAVLLGNYNYQVGNGGHTQWVDNGYAQLGPDLLTHLQLIKAHTDDPEVKSIIDQLNIRISYLLSYVNLDVKPKSFFTNYWRNPDRDMGRHYGYDEEDEDDYPDHEEPGAQVASNMDDWYYETVTPLLLPAVEAYLTQQEPTEN